jgi:hypothetical protein
MPYISGILLEVFKKVKTKKLQLQPLFFFFGKVDFLTYLLQENQMGNRQIEVFQLLLFTFAVFENNPKKV